MTIRKKGRNTKNQQAKYSNNKQGKIITPTEGKTVEIWDDFEDRNQQSVGNSVEDGWDKREQAIFFSGMVTIKEENVINGRKDGV